MPIFKIQDGPYTETEWVIVLQHSTPISHYSDKSQSLMLTIEHLSRNRLWESLKIGLESVHCQSLRGEIWKLICRVHNSKIQYSRDVFNKFLQEDNQHAEFKIKKDLFRTLPGNKEFLQPAASGENRLFNVLKAYAAYDPEIGYC